MKQLFTRILEWPAWVIGAVIFAQLLTIGVSLGLSGHLLWSRLHPAPPTSAGWSLDSTTYYKQLYQQGKLNYELYLGQKTHDERLAKLDKKRKATHRHIDSLSGNELQHYLDSLYNGEVYDTRRQRTGSRPAGPQTNAANGSGGPSGAKGPGRPDHAPGRSAGSRHVIVPAEAGDPGAGADDSATQPAPATKAESKSGPAEPDRAVPAAVARSQTGKLNLARSPGVVRNRETRTYLTYWRLIRQQSLTYPEVAWAISAAETGYWWSASELAGHGHNLFGMKKNDRMFYVAISQGGYCLYANQLASLDDYGAYEEQVIRKYGLTTQGKYIDHICRRFCPNPAYRGKLALAFQTLRKVKALT